MNTVVSHIIISEHRGFSKTFKSRMKLSLETNDKEFSLQKTKAIGCLYQFANIKTEFKELRDKEKRTEIYTGSL